MTKKILILIIFMSNTCFAQDIKMEGFITDSLTKKKLSFANVIADPKKGEDIQFAMSDENGFYSLNLTSNKEYTITVSFLGYTPKSFTHKAKKNAKLNHKLSESAESLDKITIKYTPPIVIKEDTINYRTNAFTNGKERKLKDVLKKLPGMEVDRAGNVKVNGKRVKRVYVENKQFFGGNTKLAVNNIPGDAVKDIQILDNHNEVKLLKGLEDSKDMVMNIKLKENKKRFVFGDIKIGSGIKKRYLAHPTLFYYSPERSANLIANASNSGENSFTLKDYVSFEGQKNYFKNMSAYHANINKNIHQLMRNSNSTSNSNQFAAIGLNQTLNEYSDFTTYIIGANSKDETKSTNVNTYLNRNITTEKRINISNNHNKFIVGRAKLETEPDEDTEITIGITASIADSNSDREITSNFDNINRNTKTLNNSNNITLDHKINIHKHFNRKNTSSVVFNYSYAKINDDRNWISKDFSFPKLINVINQNIYNIHKDKKNLSHNLNFLLKHYFVLNRMNHLHFSVGSILNSEKLKTDEYQQLKNNKTQNFENFGNDTSLDFINNFIGIHYRTRIGKLTMKPGVFYHNYKWSIFQKRNRLNKAKNVILPECNLQLKINNSETLDFDYKLNTRFLPITGFANNYTLSSFNSIYKGNQNIENELFHNVNLSYSNFNFITLNMYNIYLDYNSKIRNLQETTILKDISMINTPIVGDFAQESINLVSSYSKHTKKLKFGVNARIGFYKNEVPINNKTYQNKTQRYSFGGKIGTRFKKLPNLEIRYRRAVSTYNTAVKSVFNNDRLSSFLEYNYEDFGISADYMFTKFTNKNNNYNNTFDIANVSFTYQPENSPWSLELNANNLFDVKFNQRNSFSNITISDSKTYILPRVILLKLNYKL